MRSVSFILANEKIRLFEAIAAIFARLSVQEKLLYTMVKMISSGRNEFEGLVAYD